MRVILRDLPILPSEEQKDRDLSGSINEEKKLRSFRFPLHGHKLFIHCVLCLVDKRVFQLNQELFQRLALPGRYLDASQDLCNV